MWEIVATKVPLPAVTAEELGRERAGGANFYEKYRDGLLVTGVVSKVETEKGEVLVFLAAGKGDPIRFRFITDSPFSLRLTEPQKQLLKSGQSLNIRCNYEYDNFNDCILVEPRGVPGPSDGSK